MSPCSSRQHVERVADGDAERGQRIVGGVGEVQIVLAGDDQQLVRRAAPVRAHADDVVVGEQDPLARDQFGLDRGAQDAPAVEAAEGALLVEDLAGHERQPEQLAVGVLDRRAGLAAVVDDRLGVADVAGGGVLLETALDDEHQIGGVAVVDRVTTQVVVRGDHEDFVDATRLGLDVHRTEVVDGERLVAVERRVQVGDHPDLPAATFVDRLQRGERVLLVPRTEGARPTGIRFDLLRARAEVGGPFCRAPPRSLPSDQ